jgi:hypothetical protein
MYKHKGCVWQAISAQIMVVKHWRKDQPLYQIETSVVSKEFHFVLPWCLEDVILQLNSKASETQFEAI